MEFAEYERVSFTVKAVEVTFENIAEVAEKCGGTLDQQKTKMLGTWTNLPVIKLKGQGENKDRESIATLGCFVVELNGNYRVYKKGAFFESFKEKAKFVTSVSPDHKDAAGEPCAPCSTLEDVEEEAQAEQEYEDASL